MHLLSLDSCCATFTARELLVHTPSLTLLPPQGLWERAKNTSTAVFLTALRPWVDTGASEVLSCSPTRLLGDSAASTAGEQPGPTAERAQALLQGGEVLAWLLGKRPWAPRNSV